MGLVRTWLPVAALFLLAGCSNSRPWAECGQECGSPCWPGPRIGCPEACLLAPCPPEPWCPERKKPKPKCRPAPSPCAVPAAPAPAPLPASEPVPAPETVVPATPAPVADAAPQAPAADVLPAAGGLGSPPAGEPVAPEKP